MKPILESHKSIAEYYQNQGNGSRNTNLKAEEQGEGHCR